MSWILEAEIEELKEKLEKIKVLVTESDTGKREIQPYEILKIINECDLR